MTPIANPTERQHPVDLRLAVPAGCAWIATAVVIGMPGVAVIALAVSWLAAGALAFIAPRIALAAGAIALCLTSIAIHEPGRHLPDPRGPGDVIATTTETLGPGQRQFEANVGSVPVLVFSEPPGDRVPIGSTIELIGTAQPADPGDDRAYLFFANSPPEVLAGPPWYLHWADALRERVVEVARDLPGDGGDLLGGLAIGDDSAVSDDLDTAMKSSSLSHLTAVSGANCAIVIGLVMLAGAAIGVPRWLRVAASVTVLVGFVVLVTPEPSVLRAAVMATLVLVALARGRPLRGVPVLALATIGLLVLDPWLARSYGFVLSVLATAGLLVLAAPLASALERWLPRWLALVIAVPLAAQVACQPIILLLDASIPTYGVVANVLAAPAAPVATVVGLAACVALAVAPPVGVLLAHLAWLPSAWIAGVAQFFADAPLARLPWPSGWLGVVTLVVVGALVVAAARYRPAGLALLLVAVAYLGLAGGSRITQQLTRPHDWQIAACDVGQGDAMVVRSADRVALIDTGPEAAPLMRCLDELGVGSIDLLVLTHFDLDHVGGVAAVTGRVQRVIVGPADERGNGLLADLRDGGALIETASRGLVGELGELRWRVLWPTARPAGIEPGNDASVTMAFDGVGACAAGCLSSLFLGDLGEASQDAVMRAGPVPEVDVVKVSHHGSSDQSERLYHRVSAAVGVVGVGEGNGYGHPTARILGILAASATSVTRTDDDGLVLLAPGGAGGTVTVWTER